MNTNVKFTAEILVTAFPDTTCLHNCDWTIPRCDNWSIKNIATQQSFVSCKMAPFKTHCDRCDKEFTTTTALLRHRNSKHPKARQVKHLPFLDGQNIIAVPKPHTRTPNATVMTGFKLWLSGVTKSLNSTLHPKVSGKRMSYMTYVP